MLCCSYSLDDITPDVSEKPSFDKGTAGIETVRSFLIRNVQTKMHVYILLERVLLDKKRQKHRMRFFLEMDPVVVWLHGAEAER